MQPTTQTASQETARFFQKVYGWMFLGLIISGLTAYLVSASPTLTDLFLGTPPFFFGLLIFEILLVVSLAWLVKKISANTAILLFLLYCFTTGLTLSVIFLVYTAGSIALTFLVTAGTFGAMSLYGYFTKTDLTQIGQFLIMGLFGLILGSLANLFMNNSQLDYIITYAGIIIFVGLTAYDVQKIKATNIIGNEGSEEDTKESIMGALELYLDFINLFLKLLRILGKKK